MYLSKYINAQHLSKSTSTSTSSTPPCEVVVLLLAPCHSFPGYGLLAELIEHTGCTVELFSPDCSPTSTSTSSSSGSDRQEHSSASTAVTPALSESKRFEADPALFIDPSGSFSSVWEGANYVLTFNSYMDDMWPTLHSQGFRLVLD